MLCLSLPSFIIALIVALFGLINIAANIVEIAKILFFIFFELFFLTFIMGGNNRKRMKD